MFNNHKKTNKIKTKANKITKTTKTIKKTTAKITTTINLKIETTTTSQAITETKI